jgi:hypothetical protein
MAMKISTQKKAIDDALNDYRDQLDVIPDELFAETPPDGGWSFAEVYSHILQATLASTIAAERCINGTCEPTKKGLTILGRFFFLFKRFPLAKVKTPATEAAKMKVVKITKEEAKNLLMKCHRRVDEITPRIKNAAPRSRYKHSRFGMLNAGQWFSFVLIHLQHHLKQLNRIKREFAIK